MRSNIVWASFSVFAFPPRLLPLFLSSPCGFEVCGWGRRAEGRGRARWREVEDAVWNLWLGLEADRRGGLCCDGGGLCLLVLHVLHVLLACLLAGRCRVQVRGWGVYLHGSTTLVRV